MATAEALGSPSAPGCVNFSEGVGPGYVMTIRDERAAASRMLTSLLDAVRGRRRPGFAAKVMLAGALGVGGWMLSASLQPGEAHAAPPGVQHERGHPPPSVRRGGEITRPGVHVPGSSLDRLGRSGRGVDDIPGLAGSRQRSGSSSRSPGASVPGDSAGWPGLLSGPRHAGYAAMAAAGDPAVAAMWRGAATAVVVRLLRAAATSATVHRVPAAGLPAASVEVHAHAVERGFAEDRQDAVHL